MFVALLMIGCGEEAQNPEDSNADNDSASAPFVDKWAEREANPGSYGGSEVLAKIKEAKESGPTELKLPDIQSIDLNRTITIEMLSQSKISDISPLAGLTKWEGLDLKWIQITDEQKAMLKKALPDCEISFD